MLKQVDSLNKSESKALQTLRLLLEQVPVIQFLDFEHKPCDPNQGSFVLARINLSGKSRSLFCAVEPLGQPRHVRIALLRLKNQLVHFDQTIIPVLIAPYLSPDAQAICRDQEVGFIDLQGNVRLAFESVYVERQVASKPVVDRRELRSLFKPKSAQVLRVMLQNPSKAWRVNDLAIAAGVSLGHVSNVRGGLLDKEWGQVSKVGLFLPKPDALLDEWRDAREPAPGKRLTFYTTLHGDGLEKATRQVLSADSVIGVVAYASFSAAHWLAPYGRTGMQYFYADENGLERLSDVLKLTSAAKGENIVVHLLKKSDMPFDIEAPAPGVICTSTVQTYLDLANAGERGREAANHLRQQKLNWSR